MTDAQKKKPTAGFWITVALVVALVAYPLSFGPACWIEARWPTVDFSFCHRPLLRIANGNGIVAQALFWYANLGTHRNRLWARTEHGSLYLLQDIPQPPNLLPDPRPSY